MSELPKIFTHLHIGGSHDGEVIQVNEKESIHILPKMIQPEIKEYPYSPRVCDLEFQTEEYRKMSFRANNRIYILEVLSSLFDHDVIEKLIDRYKKDSE